MLLPQIDRFLRATRMKPTVFGRLAARDPRLVRDLRNGRVPRARMVAQVQSFMSTYLATQGNDHHVR